MQYFITVLIILIPIILIVIKGKIENPTLKEITFMILTLIYYKMCLNHVYYISGFESSVLKNICIIGIAIIPIYLLYDNIKKITGLNKKD